MLGLASHLCNFSIGSRKNRDFGQVRFSPASKDLLQLSRWVVGTGLISARPYKLLMTPPAAAPKSSLTVCGASLRLSVLGSRLSLNKQVLAVPKPDLCFLQMRLKTGTIAVSKPKSVLGTDE